MRSRGWGFDDSSKADNYILSIVSRANEMIGLMVRNCTSREAKVISKLYKTRIRFHTEYCTQA